MRALVVLFIVLLALVLSVAGQKAKATTTTTTTAPPKKDGWEQPMKYLGTETGPPGTKGPKAGIVIPAVCDPPECPEESSCASGRTSMIVDAQGCPQCICTPPNCPPYDSTSCASGASCPNGLPGSPVTTGGCTLCLCQTSPPTTTTEAPTTTTAAPTPTPEATTTVAPATTTEQPTTPGQTTTVAPTTPGQTTTQSPTTPDQTTTQQPTKPGQTTTQEPSTGVTTTTTTTSPSSSGSPSTSTGSPSTSTGSPSTSTGSPSTSTGSPSTSTGSPSTSTGSPSTSTGSPSTSTGSPSTSTGSPTTSTGSPSTSTTGNPFTSSTGSPSTSTGSPSTSTGSPSTSTGSPSTSTGSPSTSTGSPSTSTGSPSTSTGSPSTSTGVPTTTTNGPTTTCPPQDCDKKCPDTTWRLEKCNTTGCPTCVCEPPRCPKVDCDASCPGTTWSLVKCEHNDCQECRCDKREQCLPVDCKAECPSGSFAVVSDEDGCPDCECTPQCPPCDQGECQKACNGNFKVIRGHSGCDECLCQPPCTKPGGCAPCRECECQSKVDVQVTLVRYLTKRAYIPYNVYYDAVTGTSVNSSSVVEQYNYIKSIKKSVSVYRHSLVSLRNVLRKLVVSGRITREVYDKADEAARRRKAALELDVLKNRLTLAELERRWKKVNALIKTLGYERHCPGVCLMINGRRQCDFHPNYVKSTEATYLRNKIFTKEIYAKVGTVVTEVKKDITTNTVQYTRRAPTYKKSLVKTNKVVRDAVWSQVLSELVVKDTKIYEYVRKFFALSTKVKVDAVDVTKLNASQQKVVRKVLLRRFKRTTVRHIRKALRSDKIKALQLKNKPVYVAPVELPTRVTREIVRLPTEVLRQKEEHIAVLLVGRHNVESQ